MSRSTNEVSRSGRYAEEELLPLSGLQHMVFCDRQAALIHVDGVWMENAFTLEGRHLHRNVDEAGSRTREGRGAVRGVQLVSYELGLSGRADVVELTPADAREAVAVPGRPGRWILHPVEYKRGKPKPHGADEVQLCAQAICLEEFFGTEISEGSLFYGQERRRTPVAFTSKLRSRTKEVAHAFHVMVRRRVVPVRFRERKCERCSLLPVCMPLGRRTKSATTFLDEWDIDDVRGEDGP